MKKGRLIDREKDVKKKQKDREGAHDIERQKEDRNKGAVDRERERKGERERERLVLLVGWFGLVGWFLNVRGRVPRQIV